jgi:pimeloyl-ACP methyl ester carboxylesterase
MSEPAARTVAVNGQPCRVWEAGRGETLGVLGGLLGCPRWSPFLEALAARRRVIVPSLPGFPGGLGHEALDDLPDWVSATLDLLEASGFEGADLVGISVGGALAAEVAAFSRASVRRLVLVSPLGLFDEGEPVADVWAQRMPDVAKLLVARPERLAAELAAPAGVDPLEWQIEMTRASEAAARLLWPTCDVGLRKRLHRITAPTLLLWGSHDRVVPGSYAKRFADGLGGPVTARTIEGAGHLADVDAPEASAGAILEFLSAPV